MPYQPRASLNNPYGPQVSFRTEDVLPPTAYYISPEDRVTVWVMTDNLTQQIYLQLRMLMPTGEIQLIPYNFAPQFTQDWYPAFEAPPWEGYLLGALCWATGVHRGQTFVSVQVMRSAPPDLQKAGVILLQGYISDLAVLSYPTSNLESTFSGRGAFLTISPGDITGGNWFAGPNPYTLWRVYACKFAYSTSAAVGNRYVGVQMYDNNNNQVAFWMANYAQQPSATTYYSFSSGEATVAESIVATGTLPPELYVPAQWSIRGMSLGMDPADTFTATKVVVEEWMGE